MVGSDEFQKYCNEHNIPNSYRIWAWAMWKHVEEKNKCQQRQNYKNCPICGENVHPKKQSIGELNENGEVCNYCKDCLEKGFLDEGEDDE
jgi:hypothetical protein